MTPSPTIALASHRWADPLRARTGLGRYAVALARALEGRGTHAYVRLGLDEPTLEADPDGLPPRTTVPGDRRVVQARWALTGRPLVESILPEVALTHVVDMTVAAPSARPVVHTVHDLFPRTHPHWADRRARVLFRGVARAVRRADHVLTPTRWVADQVVRHLGVAPGRVTAVPEGVDASFLHVPAGGDPTVPAAYGLATGGYWVAVGRPGPRKNLEILVDALASVGDGRPLVVVGPDGPSSHELHARAGALGVADRIRLPGFVDDAELPHLVAGARALLHPAREEGFGLPPLEAMAVGTPVVATPSAAIVEVAGGVALHAGADDVDAWAGCLVDLARDDRLCRQLGEAGRRRAAAFTWDATAAATEEVYATCLR